MKLLSILSLSLLIPTALCANVVAVNGASANNAPTYSEFKSVEQFNTMYDVPTIEKEGVVLDSVFVYPSGKTTNQKKVLLDECGTYVINYSGIVDGKPYSEKHSFIVENQYYSFTSTKSFASYENSDRTYGYEGLFVNLYSGDSITFNQEIDFTSLTKYDQLINFYVAPKDIGKLDFTELDIKFFDAKNEDRYFTVRCKASNAGASHPYTYIDAGGNGQDFVGVEHGTNIHTNDIFGTPVAHSFYGTYTGDLAIGKTSINIEYDTSEKSVHSNNGGYFVTDFDNSKYYSRLWDGFESNKVKMTITAIGNSAADARFVIKSARDIDLKQTIIHDEVAPVISIDNPYSEMPAAREGYTYPIFKAAARDNLSGNVEVKPSVFYVKEGKRYNVSILNDGNQYFETKYSGTYEIVYTAVDAVGNKAVEKLVVETSDSIPEINIVPKTAPVIEIKRGYRYTLPNFQVSGGSGNLSSRFEITINGKEISAENNSFVARDVGVYEITYIVKDITGKTKTYFYTVSSEGHNGGAFEDDAKLPKYFISGYSNVVPLLTGFDYGQDGKEIVADVDITMKGETFTVKSGEYFTPEVNESMDEIKLVYKVKDATKTYFVPCVDVYTVEQGFEVLDIGKYFLGDDFDINTACVEELNKSRISSKINGDVSWEFANKLLANSASVKYEFEDGHTTFSELDMVLVDSLNPNEKLTIRATRSTDETIYVRSGDGLIKTDIEFGSNEEFTLAYKNGTFGINKSFATVERYDNGEVFNGFSSNYVYISTVITNAKTDSSYFVKMICNQIIGKIDIDLCNPIVEALDNYGGFYKLNDKILTTRIIACDVLDPTVSASLTAKDPSGKIISDTSGVSLSAVDVSKQYEISLSAYGQYNLIYTVSDSINTTTFSYSVGVLDADPPVITITSEYNTSCKVGEYIYIPEYTVKDNVDENVTSYVSVRNPYGSSYLVPKKSNSVKTTTAGEYIVTITAIDLAGNMAQFSYVVTVK